MHGQPRHRRRREHRAERWHRWRRHAFLESNRRGESHALRIRLSCHVVHRRALYDLLTPDAPAPRALGRSDPHTGERVNA